MFLYLEFVVSLREYMRTARGCICVCALMLLTGFMFRAGGCQCAQISVLQPRRAGACGRRCGWLCGRAASLPWS